MDIKKYKVFAKTAELSSLTRAAEELGITQSGVSHIIAAVEAEFGFTLLTRIRNGVRLTPEGKRILPHIRSLLREETLLLREAAEIRGAATGVVCIGTFTSVATHWLPSMIKEFQQEYLHLIR